MSGTKNMAPSKRTHLIQAMMPYDMIRLEFASRRVIWISGERLPSWRFLTAQNVLDHFSWCTFRRSWFRCACLSIRLKMARVISVSDFDFRSADRNGPRPHEHLHGLGRKAFGSHASLSVVLPLASTMALGFFFNFLLFVLLRVASAS